MGAGVHLNSIGWRIKPGPSSVLLVENGEARVDQVISPRISLYGGTASELRCRSHQLENLIMKIVMLTNDSPNQRALAHKN